MRGCVADGEADVAGDAFCVVIRPSRSSRFFVGIRTCSDRRLMAASHDRRQSSAYSAFEPADLMQRHSGSLRAVEASRGDRNSPTSKVDLWGLQQRTFFRGNADFADSV